MLHDVASSAHDNVPSLTDEEADARWSAYWAAWQADELAADEYKEWVNNHGRLPQETSGPRTQTEIDQLLDEYHETCNALRQAEAEVERERAERAACACYQAHPDIPNLTPGHICGDCACQCMICWDKRMTRQRARAAGECYCLTFWNEVTHDLGMCGCECPDCQLKQEVFKEADDKLWHAAFLKGFEEKASEPELPFPEDHVDPWCECETCASIVRHNTAIENARLGLARERKWQHEQEEREHAAWLLTPEGIEATARAKAEEEAREAERKQIALVEESGSSRSA